MYQQHSKTLAKFIILKKKNLIIKKGILIKREEFEELKNTVKSLAIAQEKTEERLN